jgi:hypothetical protein
MPLDDLLHWTDEWRLCGAKEFFISSGLEWVYTTKAYSVCKMCDENHIKWVRCYVPSGGDIIGGICFNGFCFISEF